MKITRFDIIKVDCLHIGRLIPINAKTKEAEKAQSKSDFSRIKSDGTELFTATLKRIGAPSYFLLLFQTFLLNVLLGYAFTPADKRIIDNELWTYVEYALVPFAIIDNFLEATLFI